MFSQACVILSGRGWGGTLETVRPPDTDIWCLLCHVRWTSGRYASYWNAFLFNAVFSIKICLTHIHFQSKTDSSFSWSKFFNCYVFTPVCQSFCSQGGVPGHVLPPAGTPPGQVHPPVWYPPGRYTPLPGRYTTPWLQCILGYGQQAEQLRIPLECILFNNLKLTFLSTTYFLYL